MKRIDHTDASQIRTQIGAQVHTMVLKGIDAADLEIVLGFETEAVMLSSAGSMQWFTLAGGPGKPPARLHGGKLDGIPMVVDAATPRLWSVRVRRRGARE